jgi:tRNA 2-thiouridine synthesizing protein A
MILHGTIFLYLGGFNLDHIVCSIGDICPIPIIKAERKLKELKSDERIILETDHSCSTSSVINHFKTKYGYPVEIAKVADGLWNIIIVKKEKL